MKGWEQRRDEVLAMARRGHGEPNDLPVLGVDPGVSGGAALVSANGSELLWWAHWNKQADDDWWLRWKGHEESRHSTLEAAVTRAGEELTFSTSRPACWRLVVEELFIHPKKRNAHDLLTLAETAGMCRVAFQGAELHRVLATVWRHSQLGLMANTPAPQAEAYALQSAGTAWGDAFPRGRGRRHLAEATFIARHGATCIPRNFLEQK